MENSCRRGPIISVGFCSALPVYHVTVTDCSKFRSDSYLKNEETVADKRALKCGTGQMNRSAEKGPNPLS